MRFVSKGRQDRIVLAQIRWLEADAFIFLPAYFVIDVMGVVWNEKDNCCACNNAYLHGLHPN